MYSPTATITRNTDGSMDVVNTVFFNNAVAASYSGATLTPTITVLNGNQVVLSVHVAPGAPITETVARKKNMSTL